MKRQDENQFMLPLLKKTIGKIFEPLLFIEARRSEVQQRLKSIIR